MSWPPALDVRAARTLVPGPAVVDGITIGQSNNNVDLARHDHGLWLAWRSASMHFATADAVLHVVRSDDEGRSWVHEHTLHAGRDVREPRLVSWQGRLLLYWFTAGTAGTRFEPDRIWVSERDARGHWSEPVAVSPPDCVVWRVRPIGDRLAMTLYRGASKLFTRDPVPLTVELWQSDDGITWRPFDPAHPVVHEGGSETDFLELADGTVLAVVRKEGPEGGWGADVCRSVGAASTAGTSRWRTRPDPRKFDSPYLFLLGDQPFLVTRRQVAFGGRFDLGLAWVPGLSLGARTKLDQAAYWLTPKRTAIYAIDPDALTATWVTDLPSCGDTAFAAGVALADGAGQLVVNYSSSFDHPRWPWVRGQLNPTHIYSVEVRPQTR